jgi:hypothetical protein
MTGLGRAFHFASAESSALPETRPISRRAVVLLIAVTFAVVFAIGAIAEHTAGDDDHRATVTVTCPAPRAGEHLHIAVDAIDGGGFTTHCSKAGGRTALQASTRIDKGGK